MVEYQVDAVAEVRASGGMLRAGLRRGVCVSGAAGQARPQAGHACGTTTHSRRQAGAGAILQHHNPFPLANIYCYHNSFIVNSRYTCRTATVKQPV